MKTFLKKLADEFLIGKNNAHFGVLQYGDKRKSRIEFNLDKHFSNKNVSQGIEEMEFLNSPRTDTGHALSVVNEQVRYCIMHKLYVNLVYITIMVPYGMVWCGVVWYGMVWYGMVWHGMVWYGMVWYGMAWHGMAWHGMAWHGMAWHGMAWHGMVLVLSLYKRDDIIIFTTRGNITDIAESQM